MVALRRIRQVCFKCFKGCLETWWADVMNMAEEGQWGDAKESVFIKYVEHIISQIAHV